MDSAGKHTDGNRLQQFTFPEEDRALFTTTPWKPGEYRWFRSSNVVPIESRALFALGRRTRDDKDNRL